MTIAMLLANTLRAASRPSAVARIGCRRQSTRLEERYGRRKVRKGRGDRGDQRGPSLHRHVPRLVRGPRGDQRGPRPVSGFAEAAGIDTSFSAWQSFDFIDLVLAGDDRRCRRLARSRPRWRRRRAAGRGQRDHRGARDPELHLRRLEHHQHARSEAPYDLDRKLWLFVGLVLTAGSPTAAGARCGGGHHVLRPGGPVRRSDGERCAAAAGGPRRHRPARRHQHPTAAASPPGHVPERSGSSARRRGERGGRPRAAAAVLRSLRERCGVLSRRRSAAWRATRDGHRDDRHHRVDPDRARQQAAVGDVERLGAVHGAVGAGHAAARVAVHARCAHRVKRLQAQRARGAGERPRTRRSAPRQRRRRRRSADRPRVAPAA